MYNPKYCWWNISCTTWGWWFIPLLTRFYTSQARWFFRISEPSTVSTGASWNVLHSTRQACARCVVFMGHWPITLSPGSHKRGSHVGQVLFEVLFYDIRFFDFVSYPRLMTTFYTYIYIYIYIYIHRTLYAWVCLFKYMNLEQIAILGSCGRLRFCLLWSRF